MKGGNSCLGTAQKKKENVSKFSSLGAEGHSPLERERTRRFRLLRRKKKDTPLHGKKIPGERRSLEQRPGNHSKRGVTEREGAWVCGSITGGRSFFGGPLMIKSEKRKF